MDMIFLITIGVLSRLMPHPANMTAVGALAIFAGAKLDAKKALLVTMGTMMITDMFLGFHPVIWATYGSMMLSIGLGTLLRNNRNGLEIAGMTLLSSVIFYLLTNFAVWAIPGSMYPKTFVGLMDSYMMAIPFFRNSLIGDLFYIGVFFGAYEIVVMYKKQFIPKIYS